MSFARIWPARASSAPATSPAFEQLVRSAQLQNQHCARREVCQTCGEEYDTRQTRVTTCAACALREDERAMAHWNAYIKRSQ
jgi:hypothetical protein